MFIDIMSSQHVDLSERRACVSHPHGLAIQTPLSNELSFLYFCGCELAGLRSGVPFADPYGTALISNPCNSPKGCRATRFDETPKLSEREDRC